MYSTIVPKKLPIFFSWFEEEEEEEEDLIMQWGTLQIGIVKM